MRLGSLGDFHVFLWFWGDPIQPSSTGSNTTNRSNRNIDAEDVEPQEPFAIDKHGLDSIFSDMDKTLRSRYKHHRAYSDCSSHTLEEVESRMRVRSLECQLGPESSETERPHDEVTEDETATTDRPIRRYSRRAHRIAKLETTVKSAIILFKFFLPLDYTCSMVAKYWGAIYDLIDVSTDASNLCMRHST